MIYVDTSVLLAQVLSESQRPSAGFWGRDLISSRITQYETWSRVYAYRASAGAHEAAGRMLAAMKYIEMLPETLARALEPFPVSVRTLDGLHLASANFLRSRGHAIKLATYDRRMAVAARAMGLAVIEL